MYFTDESTFGDMTVLPGEPDLSMSTGDPPGGCTATTTYAAQQSPAAMMVVLDRSSSMSQGSKWTAAAQAIVQAIDQDVFNSMWLSLYAAPSGTVSGPACFPLPVSCAVPPFAQVALAPAGSLKSSGASGVRRDIKSYLANNPPDSGYGDASPLYAAVQAAMVELRAWPTTGKRMMMIVTDGSISCNELSSPARPGYPDPYCKRDWEDPNNIVSMLSMANQDPAAPIETFVVGVPGSDTYDPTASKAPPYHMRLALSAMAYAGAPKYVPDSCTGRVFTKDGGDPTISCHFDLTQGQLSATTLASVISTARGKVAACTYDLPTTDGQIINKDKLNVSYTVDGNPTSIYRRKSTTNTCATDGCWDYNSAGQVQLIGKACSDVQAAKTVDVKLTVGCFTIVG